MNTHGNRGISGKLSHKGAKQLKIREVSKTGLSMHDSTQGPTKRWNDRKPRDDDEEWHIFKENPCRGRAIPRSSCFICDLSKSKFGSKFSHIICTKFWWWWFVFYLKPSTQKRLQNNSLQSQQLDFENSHCTSSIKHTWFFEQFTHVFQYFPGWTYLWILTTWSCSEVGQKWNPQLGS